MRLQRMSIGLGALAALVMSPRGTPQASAASNPAALTHCQSAQLAVAPDYSEGALGHARLVFLIHNRSGQRCTLYGYPGAQLLDDTYRALATHLRWDNTGAPLQRLLTLVSGADAYLALRWATIPTGSQSCPRASFVQITIPQASGGAVVWLGQGGIRVCGGTLIASPIVPAQFDFGTVPTR